MPRTLGDEEPVPGGEVVESAEVGRDDDAGGRQRVDGGLESVQGAQARLAGGLWQTTCDCNVLTCYLYHVAI